MDDAIRRARESRQAATDFFSANPGQQYLCAAGAVYTPDGTARFYGTSTRLLSPDLTVTEAHQIARSRGQALYLTQQGDTLCADSAPPGAVRVHVRTARTRPPTEQTGAPCPIGLPGKP